MTRNISKTELIDALKTLDALDIAFVLDSVFGKLKNTPNRKCDLCGQLHGGKGVGSVCPDCFPSFATTQPTECWCEQKSRLEQTARLRECSQRLLDILDTEGKVDHITHEGAIADLREAINDCTMGRSEENRYIVYEDEDGEHETDTLDELFGNPNTRLSTAFTEDDWIRHFIDMNGGHNGDEVWNVRIKRK